MEETLLSNLDIFSQEPVLLSVERYEYQEIPTRTTLSVQGIQQVEWTIPADKLMYTSLNETYMYLKVSIVKQDGSANDDPSKVGPVNNLIGSLFKSIDLKINNR